MPKRCYAAIDIGTSRLKLGVYGDDTRHIELLFSAAVPVHIADETATIHWSSLKNIFADALHALGQYCSEQCIDELHLGLCGQVSSLLPWNVATGASELTDIPIWLDRRCASSMDDVNSIIGNSGFEYLSSYLPMATNWLAVKVHHYLRSNRANGKKFLQLHDALFYQLTGKFWTHPSSQVSIFNQAREEYAKPILDAMALTEQHFPEVQSGRPTTLLETQSQKYALPTVTKVYAGLADMYSGFNGFFLEPGELFWQCNTSEIFGYYGESELASVLMRQPMQDSWIYYGSTNSGGQNINWFLEHEADRYSLDQLTTMAADIPVGSEGLIYLPFLSGERAPHWNPHLSASFVGLQSHHTKGHMFRSLLEGIAFNKRDILSHLPADAQMCKISGGSSINQLWNEIRANIIRTPLMCIEEKEVALLGVLRHMADVQKDQKILRDLRSRVKGSVLNPSEEASAAYDRVYADYTKHVEQALLQEGAAHA